jgi:NADH-quinone oxidoreductase subunit J
MAILGLCLLAAVGIGLLLPSDRALTLRRLGGALATVAGVAALLLLARTAQWAGLGGETGIYFWIFSAIAIGSAVQVITQPRPVYSALYFVLTVFASAGLFVLLQAQFMAAALVLIYAGAVLVTYVFVIMLASESSGGTGSAARLADADRRARDPFLAGVVGFTLLGVILLVAFDSATVYPTPPTTPPAASPAFRASPEVSGDTQKLGAELYQTQLVSVQVAMVILTLAMTGAVIISKRKVFIASPQGVTVEVVDSPAAPTDDDPHSIPVYGTDDPRAKEFPQT